MVKRIINWKFVESAVILIPQRAEQRIGIKVTFNSGEWINLWYDTEEEAEEFFTAMRRAYQYPCPGLYVINQ